MENNKNILFDSKTGMMIVVLMVMICSYLIVIPVWQCRESAPFFDFLKINPPSSPENKETDSFSLKDIKKFASEKEFKDYIERGQSFFSFSQRGIGAGEMDMLLAPRPAMPQKESSPARVSETNIQVAGVDEPDIVKTDGKNIYFSSEYQGYYKPLVCSSGEKCILPRVGATNIFKAFPPEELSKISKIDLGGKLILSENVLVVFGEKDINGYDVSDPKNPDKKWNLNLDSNAYIFEARLYGGKIYLVIRNYINSARPCPFVPIFRDSEAISIRCEDIFHPVLPIPVDNLYTAMTINIENGKVENKISFVGSYDSVLYMSENYLYVTYAQEKNMIRISLEFYKEKCGKIIPEWLISKIETLESYDISQEAKITELGVLWNKFINSLGEDERLKIQNELTNKFADYYKENKRRIESTGVVKIALDNLKIINTGKVPGRPLNQFSLDEYRENLRMATTISGSSFWGWRFGVWSDNSDSANDVYILDKNLKEIGSVKDLGVGESIYSVRFLEDKGYVVTFRQIDPFYVLDLGDPKNPKKAGELKIPGYSSYLHPINKDKILGIGQENWRVKISLFDVLNPNNPKELDKYILDEGWSEVLNTHHAFLLDEKHGIFFLPGGKGGYIFDYKNDKLNLVKAISGTSIRRAVYFDDYLYLIADGSISVLNEFTWERLKEIKF